MPVVGSKTPIGPVVCCPFLNLRYLKGTELTQAFKHIAVHFQLMAKSFLFLELIHF